MKKLEINTEDFKYNIELIKNTVIGDETDDNGNKTQIIAIVKSNGMGLDLVQYSKFLVENGIDFLGVANTFEALELRNAGINAKIIMLTPVIEKEELELLLAHNIILTIGSLEEFKKTQELLEKRGEEAKCHIKVDTGLARYGFLYDNTEIIDCYEQSKQLKITGIFTHFSKPDNEKWTRIQFNRFLDVVAGIKASGYEPGLLHVASTTAALRYKDMRLNAVRIGSAFQGRTLVKELGLKTIGVVKTDIREIKTVPKGYNISYSNSYKTKKETKIAIIPVGYQDGFFMDKKRDSFSLKDNIISTLIEFRKIFRDNYVKAEIKGKKYNIIGRVRYVSCGYRYYWI